MQPNILRSWKTFATNKYILHCELQSISSMAAAVNFIVNIHSFNDTLHACCLLIDGIERIGCLTNCDQEPLRMKVEFHFLSLSADGLSLLTCSKVFKSFLHEITFCGCDETWTIRKYVWWLNVKASRVAWCLVRAKTHFQTKFVA